MKPIISVVIPVYGGEYTIDELILRLIPSVQNITSNFEIILVDDCGPDRSWEKIRENCSRHKNIKGIKLSRNFGQHFAITAGIDIAEGENIIVMDCDLQDDPKYISDLYNMSKKGFDIVYTNKQKRKHSVFKNITAYLFNIIFNSLIENKSNNASSNIGAYSLITRKVANAFKDFNDYQRHYLMVLRWLGFKSTFIFIEHKDRFAGKSSYNFSKLMRHAINGITSQSDKLLRIFVTIGLFISSISFLTILFIILLYFTRGFMSGWASTIVVLLFSTGVILTGIGVLGIYLGKTYEQTKNRPKYIIDEMIN